MLGMEELKHILRLCVVSPYIKGERSVSILLIAPPEHGKTELLSYFSGLHGIDFSTNFDAHTFNEVAIRIESEQVKTLIIPDFLQVLKRKPSTKALSVAILNALTEEGWHGTLFLGKKLSHPIRANVLTSTTSDSIEHGGTKRMLRSMGFLSRFIPVSFSYSESLKSDVRRLIRERKYYIDAAEKEALSKPKAVELPIELAYELEKIALDVAASNENPTGFRLQKQLQVLAMSNALFSKRKIVTQEDVDIIKSLSKWMNFNYSKV